MVRVPPRALDGTGGRLERCCPSHGPKGVMSSTQLPIPTTRAVPDSLGLSSRRSRRRQVWVGGRRSSRSGRVPVRQRYASPNWARSSSPSSLALLSSNSSLDELPAFPDVTIVRSQFEDWEPPKTGFDAVVAASSWHWLDPATRWQKAHDVLNPSGWLVLLGHIVVADPGELEVFAETADLHEAHASGHPSWGHPPTAQEVIAAAEAVSSSISEVERVIGRAPDPSETDLFQSPILRWYRQVQHFDAHGYVEHLRTTSLYESLGAEVREPLLSAIEQRIRDRMDNKATRRYLISARLAQSKR